MIEFNAALFFDDTHIVVQVIGKLENINSLCYELTLARIFTLSVLLPDKN